MKAIASLILNVPGGESGNTCVGGTNPFTPPAGAMYAGGGAG